MLHMQIQDVMITLLAKTSMSTCGTNTDVQQSGLLLAIYDKLCLSCRLDRNELKVWITKGSTFSDSTRKISFGHMTNPFLGCLSSLDASSLLHQSVPLCKLPFQREPWVL